MATRKKTSRAQKPQADEPDDLPPEMLGFSARLNREIEKKLGEKFSQTLVKQLTGVSQPTISNLLTRPDRTAFRLSTILKIAKALEISLDVLLLDRPDPWRLLSAVARNRQGRIRVDGEPEAPLSLPTQPKKSLRQT